MPVGGLNQEAIPSTQQALRLRLKAVPAHKPPFRLLDVRSEAYAGS